MSTSAMHDVAGIRREIDATNAGFMQAMQRGDVAAAVGETYTRSARIFPPDAPAMQGHDAIVQFWTAAGQQLGITGVELATVELQHLGDAACEIGRATLTLGGGQQAVAKYIVVWRQEDGRWRWDLDMWNMDPS
jgi:ketosteroid isomerase-like protein